MRKKQIYFTVLFLGFLVSCNTKTKSPNEFSKGVIKFSSENYDFGKLPQDTVVVHRFNFVNNGEEPFFIKDVKAACGCTSPDWTKEQINPGDSGFVEARFSSQKIVGNFNKYLTVFSNTKDSVLGLFISGMVYEKVKTIEELYPDSLGVLRVNTRNYGFGDITNEKTSTNSIRLYNSTDKNIVISKGNNWPDYYSFIQTNYIIKPNQMFELPIMISPKKRNLIGSFFDRLSLVINNDTAYVFTSGSILEYFAEKNPTVKNSPVAEYSDFVVSFGTIKKGEIAKKIIKLKNKGSKKLLVRRIEPSCYCVKATMSSMEINPNQEQAITIQYDSKESNEGPDVKTITFYTNDPAKSVVILSVNVTIIANKP